MTRTFMGHGRLREDLYERLVSKYGGRFDYWIKYVEVVAQFVEKYKIPPVEREHLLMDDPVPLISPKEMKELADIPKIRPYPPFPGGLRIPHLHLRGDIYLLTDKQWKEFSGMAVKNLQEKLGTVGTVGFDQLMELSETMGGLC